MDIKEIETKLASQDMYDRLDGIKALNEYETEIALPLLLKLKQDEQFLVRSFVAMGLGKNKTDESFANLLEILKLDQDTNVRAEASNSLSLFGEVAIPHLKEAFYQDEGWLVRLTILGALMDLNCPPQELFEVCLCGLQSSDYSVKEHSLSCLASLSQTEKEEEALNLLLSMVNDASWRVRLGVAQSLASFSHPSAKEALIQLKHDDDVRVMDVALKSNN